MKGREGRQPQIIQNGVIGAERAYQRRLCANSIKLMRFCTIRSWHICDVAYAMWRKHGVRFLMVQIAVAIRVGPPFGIRNCDGPGKAARLVPQPCAILYYNTGNERLLYRHRYQLHYMVLWAGIFFNLCVARIFPVYAAVCRCDKILRLFRGFALKIADGNERKRSGNKQPPLR